MFARRAARPLAGALIAAALALVLVAAFAGRSAAADPPVIYAVEPARGPVGTPVTIRGSNFGGQLSGGVVSFNGVQAPAAPWSNNFIVTRVPDAATTGPVTVSTSAGISNGVNFTVDSPPAPTQTWYLAEGTTSWGFETFVLMENTTNVDATVEVVYQTPQYGRLPRAQPLNVPPYSRVTLNLNNDLAPLQLDVSTELRSSQPIVCERSMYWAGRGEGTDSVGVTGRSKTWYFAEGRTWWPYETWLLLQNPSVVTAANVTITYMTSKGVVEKAPFTVGAGQRKSIDVSKDVGQCDVSAWIESDQPIVCERSMYWNERRGGHNSIGITDASPEWYLAEGSSAWGFETWLLVQNPNDSEVKADVTFMTDGGPVAEPTRTLPANSRTTIRVNDLVPNADTSIKVSADAHVIAERAMYWDTGSGRAGHGTIGMTAPAGTIHLAEGSSAWGFDSFVCLQNPNDEAAEVNVTYLTNEGPVAGIMRVVPANSRITVRMADELPDRDASVRLDASVPITAERAVYWNARGGGHCSIGWVPPD